MTNPLLAPSIGMGVQEIAQLSEVLQRLLYNLANSSGTGGLVDQSGSPLIPGEAVLIAQGGATPPIPGVFVGTFNSLPRRLVRRFGWHLLAFCTK